MVRTLTLDNELVLSFLSPRDFRFKKWKQANELLAMELVGVDNKLATKLGECATWLLFKQTDDGLKLNQSNFCRQKICPLCSWRKRLVWLNRLHTSLNTIKCLYRDSTPKKKFSLIFLTLSQKNCLIDDLGKEIKRMSKAWDRFTEPIAKNSSFYPKVFPADGYFRALEVTTKLINCEVFCNVHYHVLMVASQGYGTKGNFISQPEWVESWRKAMQLDYNPTAHIKFIKFGKQSEIVKYLCKPLNYSIGIERTLKLYPLDKMNPSRTSNYDSLLVGLSEQLRNSQQFTTGGIIRRYMPRRDDDNLINTRDTNVETEQDLSTPNLLFRWDAQDYRLQTFD